MDLRRKLFKRFALVLFGVFVINTIASFLYWYQSMYWFDNFMHFWGGVAGGLFLSWFFFSFYGQLLKKGNSAKIILINTLIFLIVAGLWEVMEFSMQDIFNIGNVLAEKNDSIMDLLFGLAGSLTALIYYLLNIKNKYARN